MATYPEQSLAKLKEFEGCVPWMYRDTVGKVGRAATAAEIAADFARDTTMAEGKAAEFYRHPASPELAQPTIDAKLMEVLEGFEGRLRAAMTGTMRFRTQ
jgi:hypothetical protein